MVCDLKLEVLKITFKATDIKYHYITSCYITTSQVAISLHHKLLSDITEKILSVKGISNKLLGSTLKQLGC